ncbi:DUF5305 family protein [Halobacterium jilantaiense]|uniref:DUF5305 domain-containing protein n=1 Tax=Halobacterium jilantaiense TaxID=355548 RepID=A0A1I0PUQ4_9EURY|nr:DUF5305 family protein [Halobacterium jilantaiense]SEW18182.1 hypothetical protein SAMN04487945_1979 [Halobacterium jilantaiense]
MTGETRWLRLRAFAGEWFVVLVVAFAVLAAAGGYAAGTAHAAPGTTTERQTVEHWAVGGEFGHSATVTRENPVFEVGETLEGRSTYFVGASPILDGTYRVSYADPTGDAEPVDVTATATLVLSSTGESATYWTDRERLATTDATLAPGETTSVAFDVNASRVDERATDIQQGLGDTAGEVTATISVAVNATGAVAGSEYPVSYTQSVPLTIAGSTYGVDAPGPTSEAATTQRTVQVAKSYGPLWTVGGPLLLLAGLAGLGALGAAYRRDEPGLTDAERDYLAFRDERAEFDEWVVRARLPATIRDRECADAESLADLVDYAIDADVGVVEDAASGSFYAVTRDLLVVYEPPAEPDVVSPLAGDFDALGVTTDRDPDEDLVEGVTADSGPEADDDGKAPPPDSPTVEAED